MDYTWIEILPMLMVIFALIFGGGGSRRGVGCYQPTSAKWNNNNERRRPKAPKKDQNL